MVKLLLEWVDIAKKVDSVAAIKHWSDWKWQIKHAVMDASTFKKLLGMREVEKTVQRFQINIILYYLSLIGAGERRYDV
jgi:lysine 2,3-aminomutase